MSEYPDDRLDSDTIRWNTGPGAETATEPTSGMKDTGHAYQEIVPYHEVNWLWGKYYEMLNHLLAACPGEYDSVAEGIAGAPDDLYVFRVRKSVEPPATATPRGQKLAFTAVQGEAGAVAISAMCTDGKYIYYAQSYTVHANDPDTGMNVWSHVTNTSVVTSLCCDGSHVWVGRTVDASEDELEALDPTDGTPDDSYNTGHTISQMASDGKHLIYCAPSDNNVHIFEYTTYIVSLGVYNHGAQVNAVATDGFNGYCGGTRSGADDISAFDLDGAHVQAWGAALSSAAAPTVNAIATDGEFLFCATDSVATATGTASIFAIDKVSGAQIYETQGGTNHDRIYVDDRYCVPVSDANDTLLLDKRNGFQILQIGSGTMERAWGLDPMGVIVEDGTGDLSRIFLGYQSRICQKCAATDVNRRPYFALAVPVSGGF